MDWKMIMLACAIALAGILSWKLWKLKQDVCEFADRLDESLDAVLQGRKPEESADTQDSLLGKVNEKLGRTLHVLETKNEENLRGKQQMKELISDISHQTRTPVANQKIYLEILKDMDLPGEATEFLNKLEHQTDRLDFLFQSLVKERGDLFDTLAGAMAAVVPAASKKSIALEVEGGGEKLSGETDKNRLLLSHDRKWTEEAVYNLLDNAVKYTPEGGRVTLCVEKKEIFTEIHVRDTGKGIALERQAQIFTRFYREPEVQGLEGLGIGLYLTRKIAELQGGYVEVRSEAGKGADFCLFLPNAGTLTVS